LSCSQVMPVLTNLPNGNFHSVNQCSKPRPKR
jgi:hypothetical protein